MSLSRSSVSRRQYTSHVQAQCAYVYNRYSEILRSQPPAHSIATLHGAFTRRVCVYDAAKVTVIYSFVQSVCSHVG